MLALGVAMVAASVLASGRVVPLLALAVGWAAWSVPTLETWFSGGADALLLGPAAVATATASAWLWRPGARGVEELVRGGAPIASAQEPNGPTLTIDRG